MPIAEVLRDADGDTVPDLLDRKVRVRGVVTIGAGTLSDEFLRLFVEDATGGIGVFDRRPADVPVSGDEVEAEGIVDQFNGAVQVKRVRLTLLGKGGPVSPRPLRVPEAASWTHFGRLVRVEGVLGPINPSGPRLARLSGEGASVKVLFPSRVARDLREGQFPEGSLVEVVGVLSLYSPRRPHRDGFQVVVRDLAEVKVIARPPPPWRRWLMPGAAAVLALAAAVGGGVFLVRQRLRRRGRALSVVNELAAKMAEPGLEAGDILRAGLDILVRHGLVDAGLVHLLDERQELRLEASAGLDAHALEALDHARMGRLLRARLLGGEALPGDALQEEKEVLRPLTSAGLHLASCMPLQGRNRIFGALCAFTRRLTGPPEQDVLVAVTRLMAMAVERVEMFRRSETAKRELEQLAITDDLTGLYNRRFLEEYCRIQFAIARRQRSTVAFLLVDIDHFKSVNDRHGHLVGDRVIAAVADALRRSGRAGDLPVRYGGEEFLLVLPATDAAGAATFAERLRSGVAKLPLGEGVPGELRVTVSIGVGLFAEQEHDLASVLEATDAALYRAKQEGRDRVELAAPPPRRGA